MKTLFPALIAAARANEPVALGIITGVQGSSPQKLGAKALFYTDRKILGTVGGGCLEAEVQRLALQSLHDNKPRTFELVLDHDFGWDDGLICGGKVSGVIIPNAQNLGITFWEDLAQRNEPKTWGIKSDYTIARHFPSGHSFTEPNCQRNDCQGNQTHSFDKHSSDPSVVHDPETRPLLEVEAPHESRVGNTD